MVGVELANTFSLKKTAESALASRFSLVAKGTQNLVTFTRNNLIRPIIRPANQAVAPPIVTKS